MSKYEECFYEYEGKSLENIKIDDEYYIKLINKYLKENESKLYECLKKEFKIINLNAMFIMYSLFSKETKIFFKENIIDKLNKNYILHTYIHILVNSLIIGNKQVIKIYMKSLIETGMIKKIKLKKNLFIITMLDNKKIKFTKLLDNIEDVNKYKNNCHSVTYEIMSRNKKEESYCVTILEKDVFYNDRYHTFLLYNNMVNDFTRNILMSFDDYKKIFKPNIIYNESCDEVKNNILELELKDKDFRENNYCHLLKYSISKQIDK